MFTYKMDQLIDTFNTSVFAEDGFKSHVGHVEKNEKNF